VNNEEKILAILEKMQSDISDLKQGQADTNARLNRVEKDVQSVKQDVQAVKISQMRTELEQYPRISAALDGFLVNRDRVNAQDERIVFLEKKTTDHDVRIFGLERITKKT